MWKARTHHHSIFLRKLSWRFTADIPLTTTIIGQEHIDLEDTELTLQITYLAAVLLATCHPSTDVLNLFIYWIGKQELFEFWLYYQPSDSERPVPNSGSCIAYKCWWRLCDKNLSLLTMASVWSFENCSQFQMMLNCFLTQLFYLLLFF